MAPASIAAPRKVSSTRSPVLAMEPHTMTFRPYRAMLLCVAAMVAIPALATDAAGHHEFSLMFDEFVKIPVWGVPVTTFGAAATGAGLSLVIGEPLDTRHMWGQVLLSTFFGVAIATLLADAADLDWAAKHPSMFALVVAGMTRWFMPSIYERGKQVIAEFKFSFSRKKDTEQ